MNAQSAPQNAPVQPNGQPVYYGVPVHQPQKQPKPKKHGSKFGLKLAVVLLLCDHLGGVAWRIRRDDSKRRHHAVFSEASSNAAFTISRVVNGDTNSDTSASSDGTVSAMSDQDIVAKLTPSVVWHPELSGDTELRFYADRHVGQQRFPGERRLRIISEEDGYIITNAHVVRWQIS